MKYSDLKIISASPDEVTVNRNELAQRLRTDREFNEPLLDKCRESFNKAVHYKCVYIQSPVDLSTEGVCDLGFMKIPSRDLYKNLRGCSEAFVMALTAGLSVDRLLARLNITSQAEHFMTDALSSAAIESFCDHACAIMQASLRCAPRYSPGYGDLSITFQKPLLERLNAFETLGMQFLRKQFVFSRLL